MSGKPNRKDSYGFINLIAVVACFGVIVVILTVIFAGYLFDNATEISTEESESGNNSAAVASEVDFSAPEISVPESSEEENTSYEASEEELYDIIILDKNDVHKGSLIVVNEDTQFDFDSTPAVSNIYKERTVKKFSLGDSDLYIAKSVMEPLQEMLGALYDYTGNAGLTIITGYRTREQQAAKYNAGKDTDMPGASEYNTGLTFKCTVLSGKGTLGSGKFAWLDENCVYYGFVQRYPEGKKAITGHSASNAIYRYVGVPHAYLMSINDYCLEEYVEFCRKFSYENKYETTCDGVTYAIYYVAAENADTTRAKIPAGKSYTVSGDNSEGFIITVVMSDNEQ